MINTGKGVKLSIIMQKYIVKLYWEFYFYLEVEMRAAYDKAIFV